MNKVNLQVYFKIPDELWKELNKFSNFSKEVLYEYYKVLEGGSKYDVFEEMIYVGHMLDNMLDETDKNKAYVNQLAKLIL